MDSKNNIEKIKEMLIKKIRDTTDIQILYEIEYILEPTLNPNKLDNQLLLNYTRERIKNRNELWKKQQPNKFVEILNEPNKKGFSGGGKTLLQLYKDDKNRLIKEGVSESSSIMKMCNALIKIYEERESGNKGKAKMKCSTIEKQMSSELQNRKTIGEMWEEARQEIKREKKKTGLLALIEKAQYNNSINKKDN